MSKKKLNECVICQSMIMNCQPHSKYCKPCKRKSKGYKNLRKISRLNKGLKSQ